MSDNLSITFYWTILPHPYINPLTLLAHAAYFRIEAIVLAPMDAARAYGSPLPAPHPRTHGGRRIRCSVGVSPAVAWASRPCAVMAKMAMPRAVGRASCPRPLARCLGARSTPFCRKGGGSHVGGGGTPTLRFDIC